jgi:hypothetical protein
MQETIYKKPESAVVIRDITLSKGETHYSGNDKYISHGPGHVVIQETPADWSWHEYPINHEKYVDRKARWLAAGFQAA